MRLKVIFALMLLLTGCATARREKEAEARGYERGYAEAVKEQYWIIQRQQRTPAPTNGSEPKS